MKKLISIIISLCLLLSYIPSAAAADYTPPELLSLPDASKGKNWLLSQDLIQKVVEAKNNRYFPDESIYDIAKESVIIWAGNRTAYVNGYRTYVGAAALVPFEENLEIYAPARFTADAFKQKCVIAGSEITLTGTKTLVFTVGSTSVTVNGKASDMGAAPVIKNDTVFLPVRVVAQAIGKKTLYDERGFIIAASQSVLDFVTTAHLSKIASPSFYLQREKVAFPHSNDVMGEMFYGYRTFLNYTDEEIDPLIEEYMNMTYNELAAAVETKLATDEEGKIRHFGDRADFERPAALMAIKYNRNKDEDLALRIIIMLYHSALSFDSQSKVYKDYFNNFAYIVPTNLVYAYDKIYHSPMWEVVSRAYGSDVKSAVQKWWRTLFEYVIVNKKGKPVGNYPTVYTHLAGIATALDDPDLMRDIVERLDYAATPFSFFADGMWYEGTASYSSSATSHPISTARVLKAFHDRRCYVDSVYGLNLNGNFDIATRWTDFLNRAAKAPNNLYFPDGSPVAINDTSYQSVEANLADNTPKEKYLGSNIEMNHFGLYGLRYGDTEEAQQINLSVQSVTGVSHQHGAPLGISYYSGGIELLPDVGYVRDSSVYRYSKTPAFAHNTAWSGGTRPGHEDVGSLYARPSVLAYDDGSTNGKIIQLVEGSNLMPSLYDLDTNRRMVMLIATDENHSYAVDIHRIKGGTVHESYLIQNEEEDATLTTSLNLPEKFSGQLSEWLTSQGKTGGLILENSYSSVIQNPQALETDDSFSFKWEGETATLNAFIKGNENATVAFSTWPTSRRTGGDSSKKDDYPGYHFYRRSDVAEGEGTVFGGVYEGVKAGEEAKVTSVDWISPDDGDDMTAMLTVSHGDFIDYIYVSDDSENREIGDFSVNGSVVIIRTYEGSGEVVFGYIYGKGEISGESFSLSGKANLSYNISAASDSEKSLTLDSSVSSDAEGLWGTVSFSDGSGTAYKIEKVNEATVTLTSVPGFKMVDNKAEFTAYPLYEDHDTGKVAEYASPFTEGMEKRYRDGDVTLTVKIPTFFNTEN